MNFNKLKLGLPFFEKYSGNLDFYRQQKWNLTLSLDFFPHTIPCNVIVIIRRCLAHSKCATILYIIIHRSWLVIPRVGSGSSWWVGTHAPVAPSLQSNQRNIIMIPCGRVVFESLSNFYQYSVKGSKGWLLLLNPVRHTPLNCL